MREEKRQIAGRLSALRKEMGQQGMDAFLVLTDDFHASEYVDDHFKCREYLSGFTGSAGTLIVTRKEAALWTDGRYFLQAEEELSGTEIRLMKMGEPGVPTIPAYLLEKLPLKGVLGFDGRCVSCQYGEGLSQVLREKQVTLIYDKDLPGNIWMDRPPFPAHRVWELPESLTGETRAHRFSRLRTRMEKLHASVHLLASLDDIAWLYGLRGSDILYNPVFMAYTLIRKDSAVLYAEPEAVGEIIKEKLRRENITLKPYLAIYEDVKKLENEVLLLDPAHVNTTLVKSIPGSVRILKAMNPTTRMKAVKTAREQENLREAHRKDGIALVKHLFWLHKLQETEAFERGEITELTVAQKLLELRRQQKDFLDLSFESIVASGAHGAIVHYAPDAESDIPIQKDSFLLMDTGAQYLQGTTDVTRTVVMGAVSEEMKRHYTAVLRGNLNLAAASFKKGTTGVNLDALARMPLWELGLDFNHGTGHGVGFLLNVHEGPQGIRMKERNNQVGVPFEPGMLTSDEPGVYLDGKYGIRLENLMLCLERKETAFGAFYGFEPVTMVPFDRRAILPEMLSDREKKLLNAYHERVYVTLAPSLTEEERSWLRSETAPVE